LAKIMWKGEGAYTRSEERPYGDPVEKKAPISLLSRKVSPHTKTRRVLLPEEEKIPFLLLSGKIFPGKGEFFLRRGSKGEHIRGSPRRSAERPVSGRKGVGGGIWDKKGPLVAIRKRKRGGAFCGEEGRNTKGDLRRKEGLLLFK